MIVTVFKKLDSEIIKSMIYARDKDRMAKDGWLDTPAEAELTKGASDGDDSSATTKAVATGNTGSGVRSSARK
jgi:hypothetical protein